MTQPTLLTHEFRPAPSLASQSASQLDILSQRYELFLQEKSIRNRTSCFSLNCFWESARRFWQKIVPKKIRGNGCETEVFLSLCQTTFKGQLPCWLENLFTEEGLQHGTGKKMGLFYQSESVENFLNILTVLQANEEYLKDLRIKEISFYFIDTTKQFEPGHTDQLFSNVSSSRLGNNQNQTSFQKRQLRSSGQCDESENGNVIINTTDSTPSPVEAEPTLENSYSFDDRPLSPTGFVILPVWKGLFDELIIPDDPCFDWLKFEQVEHFYEERRKKEEPIVERMRSRWEDSRARELEEGSRHQIFLRPQKPHPN